MGAKRYYSANNAQTLNDALGNILNMVTGSGEFGMAACDDSCYTNGCDPGYVCVTTEQSNGPTCVPDPCAGVGVCPDGSYCRQGGCVQTCPHCAPNELCQDGNCVADPCAGVSCMGSQVCNPQTGGCIDNLCVNVMCKAPSVCDLQTGLCADDPCHLVSCPMGTTCQTGGNCETSATGNMGGGTGHRATGCGIAHSSSSTGAALAAIAWLGLALITRRRKR
jgi:MYXO-CTERM domain-containing protein